jgi:hypothetical protein
MARFARVTASFAVITVGLIWPTTAVFPTSAEWEWIDQGNPWRVGRTIVASGSSRLWSPITPKFRLPVQEIVIKIASLPGEYGLPDAFGAARLDHDGGSALYTFRCLVLPPAPPRQEGELSDAELEAVSDGDAYTWGCSAFACVPTVSC